MGLAIVLLAACVILPWWGSSRQTVDPRYSITRVETVQFGPWLTTHWYSSVAGVGSGFFVLQAIPMLWWDFPREFPAYASYTPVAATLCAIWSAAVALAAVAMWARGAPRRRFSGLPTVAEAAVGVLVAVAILVSFFEFPPAGGRSSFSGVSSDGSVMWGPGLGWYVGMVIVGLAFGAACIGYWVDRKLVGVCWFCFRPTVGDRCEYCGSVQRRPRRIRGPEATADASARPPKQRP